MHFTYFSGDAAQIGWHSRNTNPFDPEYAPTPVECGYCGVVTLCIGHVCSLTKRSAFGCLECLRSAKFQIYHQTEFGLMVEGRRFLRRVGNPFQGPVRQEVHELHVGFTPEAFDELLQTPPFLCLQHEDWLIHCNDFMVALGRWTTEDFAAHDENGDADSLFRAMLADGWQNDSRQSPNPHMWFSAFRCRRCGTLRGYYE